MTRLNFRYQWLFVPLLCLHLSACSSSGDTTDDGTSNEPILLEIKPFTSNCTNPSGTNVQTGSEDQTTDSDQGTLDCQLHYDNSPIDIVGSDGSASQSKFLEVEDRPSTLNLRLIASIDAPEVDGVSLGATDVIFDGNYAIVTYNTAGETYRGAVQIVDVSDPNRPFLVAQTVFKATDVSTGVIDGSNLYLAEAQSTDVSGFDTPAQLQSVTLNEKLIPDVFLAPISLPSFVGTDVLAIKERLYVTTGDTGGLVILDRASLKIIDFIELDDARSLAFNEENGRLYVFQGTPGQVTSLNLDGSAPEVFGVKGANIPESKSTIEITANRLFLGAGDGGAIIMNAKSGEVENTIPNPSLPDVPEENVVTNSVTVQDNLLFISNGEAGIRAASWQQEEKSTTSEIIGTLDFSQAFSANGIAYRGDFLMVASGTAGLSIVKVIRSPYVGKLDCSITSALFCDDFRRPDGTVINDNIKWSGKTPKPSSTVIDEGGRIDERNYIETVPSFNSSRPGKQYSIKLLKSNKVTVLNSKNSNFGIEMSYNGSNQVIAYLGETNNKNRRQTVEFTFPKGQDFVILHVYMENLSAKVGIELEDGSKLATDVLSLSDKKFLEEMKLRVEPLNGENQSPETPYFTDVLVEEFSF